MARRSEDHKITLLKPEEVKAYGVTKDPKADGYCATCWLPVKRTGTKLSHRAPVASRS
jgi:hypothetical protein